MNGDRKFKHADLIVFSLHKGIINDAEATQLLLKEFNNMSGRSDTSLKHAVTYLDYNEKQ